MKRTKSKSFIHELRPYINFKSRHFFTNHIYTYSSHSTVKSRPIEEAGMARAVQIMTITTSEELGTEGSARVEIVVKVLQENSPQIRL